MEEIWEVSGGNLAQFVVAAHLAVIDFRDLRVWADEHRESSSVWAPANGIRS